MILQIGGEENGKLADNVVNNAGNLDEQSQNLNKIISNFKV